MKALVPCALAALVSLAFACEGTLIANADCGEIPSGGCLDKGDAVDQCEDRSCSALYLCVRDRGSESSGTWQHQRECPERPEPDPDASAPVERADADAGDASSNEAGNLPSDLPAGAYGGPGCISLQLPDCALAVGYACSTACCGCEELYLCRSGGWESWGTCVDDVPTPH